MNRNLRRLALILAAAVGLGALPALAQEAAATGDPVKTLMSIKEIMQTGGWLMYVLAGMSVLGVALIVYYLAVLQTSQVIPRPLVRDLRSMLSANRLQEARAACRKKPCPMSAITLAALDYIDTVPTPDAGLLKEVIEGEGTRQSTLIQNSIQYLLDIAVIAPMVGLLGTVMGMLTAFNSVALDIAKAKPMVLAAGVSQALITTAAGLIVGIPAMAFYAYFRNRASRMMASLETSSAELLTLLVHKRLADFSIVSRNPVDNPS